MARITEEEKQEPEQNSPPRKKEEFVFVHIENDVAGLTYPVWLGRCTKDEVDRKVEVQWYGKYAWKGKGMSAKNSQFAVYWERVEDDNGDVVLRECVEIMDVGSVLPVQVTIATQRGEVVRVHQDSVEAAVQWCKDLKKEAWRKRKAGA